MEEFVIHIENKKVTNGKVFRKKLDALADGTYTVIVKTRKQRSLNQNGFYWGIVVDMVKDGLRDVGYDDFRTNDQVHEFLKVLFLKKDVPNKLTGEVITMVQSTRDLTTIEFMDYLERIAQWASEFLGIVIPQPNTQSAFF